MSERITYTLCVVALPAGVATFIGFLAFLSLLFLSPLVTGPHWTNVIGSSFAVFLLPVLVGLAWFRTSDGIRALGLRLPSVREVLGGCLLGCSFWVITLLVVVPFSIRLFGWDEPGDLAKQIAAWPVGVTVLALAVTPAISEEVFFRGVLCRSLTSRFGMLAGILVSSALFGAIHGTPAQMLPAFGLGLVVGTLAVRANSIVPSIIAHALNNAIAIFLTRMTSEPDFPVAWVSLAVITSGFALWYARKPAGRG